MKFYLLVVTATLLTALEVHAGESIGVQGESFAQEYTHLRELLVKVQTRELAMIYKSQIAEELYRLHDSHINGGRAFDALSAEEQQAFIKKFQNNQFHCGEVTRVMEERRRILLDPDLKEVLGSLIKDIP